MNLSKNRTVFSIIIALAIILISIVAIFWARGFKPDIRNGKIQRTGLIVASSIPTGAQVYLNDRLTSATDTNIAFLDPGTYKIRIQKDGYTTWEKEIEIKADLASEIKALLFPTAPQITPLTTTGATNPTLSPDSTRIIYGVTGPRGGAYLLPMDNRPFAFRQEARLLVKNAPVFDFSKAKFIWDPTSKQVVATFTDSEGSAISNLILDTDKTDQEARDITGSLNSTIESWQDQLNTTAQTQAIPIPQAVKDATAEAAVESQSEESKSKIPKSLPKPATSTLNYYPTGLILSPDEEKVLYKNKENAYKVYDLKTKKEFTIPHQPDLINISWFPDSNHLVVAQNPASGGLISIIEADGQNKMVIYSGKFENGFVFTHPNANRLIVLTALTQQEGTPANLYSINLK